ncbi:MAG: SH3 domain-containing protein [Sphingomonadaceae bacterium]
MTNIGKMMSTAALASLAVVSPAHAIGTTVTQTPNQTQATMPVAATDEAAPRSGGFLGGLFGCAADGDKQVIGAAAGVAVGGLLGNQIAGRGSRTLGTLIGGALGAAAGSAIGCKLQKTDRDRAERAAQAALETNSNQDWTNAETGASGTVAIGQTDGIALGNMTFASGVEPATGYVKVGQSFTAGSTVNVRSAPGTRAPVLGKLAAGQRVWVPAAVKGQPWMLVSENGVGRGYVSAPLLKRATTATASNCKMVTQTVSLPGEPEAAERYQACKDTAGQWTMTRV